MERTITIKLKENDAYLLMQLCNMLTEQAVADIFDQVEAAYSQNDMIHAFDRYYHDFDPVRMAKVAGNIMEKLEEVLLPEDEVVVDCRM